MPLHRRTRQVQLQGNFSLRKACCMEAMDFKESMLINHRNLYSEWVRGIFLAERGAIEASVFAIGTEEREKEFKRNGEI